MGNRTFRTRIHRIEQQVAREEYAQFECFLEEIRLAWDSSLSRWLSDRELHERIRERSGEILCPNHREKAERHSRRPKGTLRGHEETMSNRQVDIALWFAGADRECLVLHLIEPTLQAFQQALRELVEEAETRNKVTEELRTGYYRVLNAFRPEPKRNV